MRIYQLVLVSILLIFSSCSQKVIYIKPNAVKLQTWEVSPLDENITYEVFEE